MLALAFFALLVCSIQTQPLQQQVVESAKKPVEAAVPIVQKAATIVLTDVPVTLDIKEGGEPEPSIEPVGPIELRSRHHGGHHHSGSGGNKALQQLVDQMWKADHDKPHMKLDWGGHLQAGSHQDSLINNVDDSVFNKPQYQALIRMYNADLFTPNVCSAEADMSGQKKALVKDVFDAFTSSPMFKLAFDYLRQRGVARDWDSFETKVWNLWMGTYSRCHHGVHGSSGWEHVFVGEWKGHEIDGQHDWVRYYMLQKQNKIDYFGYKEHDGDLIGSFSYSWEDHLKKLGGFYLGTSPAFDFSLFTVCALSAPGAGKCQFSIEQYHNLGVVSYTQQCDAGLCLATAYPVE